MTTPLSGLRPPVRVHSVDQCTAGVLPSQGFPTDQDYGSRESVRPLTVSVIVIHLRQDIDCIAGELKVGSCKES